MILTDLLRESLVLKRNVRLSKTGVKNLQKRKFRDLVRYISVHSPYYADIIRKNNINIDSCTPEDFPVLTKQVLLEHFDDIVTDRRITKEKAGQFLDKSKHPTDLFLDKYIVIHTSGSSGVISYYLYTEKELIQGLAPVTRVTGFKPFQKLAYIAAVRGHFAGITMVSAAHKLPFLYKEVRPFDINMPFSEIIKALNEMQPTVISGYAFALRKLAEAQREGLLHISPKLLESGGEPLLSVDKRFIQDEFHAPIVNLYAASEFLMMGLGRDEFEGMYLMEDNLWFSVKSNGTEITNLYNFTLPLIRYHMSDRLEEIKDTTHMMPFMKVSDIAGRHEAIPTFQNEKGAEDFISPHIIGEIFVRNLQQFQIQLKDKTSFVFKALLAENLSKDEKTNTLEEIEQVLKKILREKAMTNVQFTVETTDRLWADAKTGKFRLIVPAS